MFPVAAIVEYDGGAYNGFQLQPNVPTIQGELEQSLARCTGEKQGRPFPVVGSGRTDTGVHARGQVIAARLAWKHDLYSLLSAWNAHLPDDIVVRRLALAPETFHPRFSAVSRTYRYSVITVHADAPQPVQDARYKHASHQDGQQHGRDGERQKRPRRSPLTDGTAFHEPRMLDLDGMNEAAARLVGEYDFATFGRPPQGTNTVRTLFSAQWQEAASTLPRLANDNGRHLVFTVKANGFLQHMVRNLVGSLLAVGLGQRTPDELFGDLLARDRKRSAAPAPPQGLVLEQVDYPEENDPFR